MRLGRLVAAGLTAGLAAGFLGALLRPRTVQRYGSDADRPATGDRDNPLAVTVPESGVLFEPAYATAAVEEPVGSRLDVDVAAGEAPIATAARRTAG